MELKLEKVVGLKYKLRDGEIIQSIQANVYIEIAIRN